MREPWQERLTLLLVALLCAVAALGRAQVLVPRWLARAPAVTLEQPEIEVSVSGEVFSPGAYSLPFGARVADLLAAAGGMTRAAAAALVNPSDPLTNGELVFVPNHRTQLGSERVSLNSGTLAELEGLPGIGPVMAQRIVANRPYSRVEDLLLVPGVGEKTLARLRPLVTL